MEHLHEPEIHPLDIDKPGYYTPKIEEIYIGSHFELKGPEGAWLLWNYLSDTTPYGSFASLLQAGHIRVKYLQALDVQSIGFQRVMEGLPQYQRGSYTIITYRLLDPTYARIKVSQNGVLVYEGICRNKSELKRILILNEINFA